MGICFKSFGRRRHVVEFEFPLPVVWTRGDAGRSSRRVAIMACSSCIGRQPVGGARWRCCISRWRAWIAVSASAASTWPNIALCDTADLPGQQRVSTSPGYAARYTTPTTVPGRNLCQHGFRRNHPRQVRVAFGGPGPPAPQCRQVGTRRPPSTPAAFALDRRDQPVARCHQRHPLRGVSRGAGRVAGGVSAGFGARLAARA